MTRAVAGHSIRPALLALAGLLLVAAIVVTATLGISGWWIVLALLAPDLLPLVAFRPPVEHGRMPASMVPLYNVTHSLFGPIVLAAASAALASPAGLVVALGWAAHIVVDRAVGYGLRTRDGQQRDQGARASAHSGAHARSDGRVTRLGPCRRPHAWPVD